MPSRGSVSAASKLMKFKTPQPLWVLIASTVFGVVPLSVTLAQSSDPSLSPRLIIEEVAPLSVDVSGVDIRLLGSSSTPAALVGDQMNASLATSGSNGFLVWQDNAIDGDGLGIGTRFYNLQTGAANPKILQVNQDPLFDQENAKVAALANGMAIVVWQSGKSGNQSIKGRFLSRAGLPLADEFTLAHGTVDSSKARPSVAALLNNSFAVVWESTGPDGVSKKIHLQNFDASGKSSSSLRVLGTSGDVDRLPSLTAHSDGSVSVAWVAEMASRDVLNLGGESTRQEVNSDIFSQRVAADGKIGTLVWVNGAKSPCDAPSIAALADHSVLVGWSEYSLSSSSGWDIRTTVVDSAGVILRSSSALNTYRPFEQVGLSFAKGSGEIMAVWNSRGADGSGLSVVARAIDLKGQPVGDEFIVNTTRLNDQMVPAAAPSPHGYRVVWSGLGGMESGVDLAAKDLRTISTVGRRSIKLSWDSIVGSKYTVQTSTDLNQWQTWQVIPSALSRQQSMTFDPSSVPNTYFRVKLDR